MLLEILLVLVIIGFVVWVVESAVVESAPFISASIKPFVRWAAIVVGGFYMLKLLLDLFHVSVPSLAK